MAKVLKTIFKGPVTTKKLKIKPSTSQTRYSKKTTTVFKKRRKNSLGDFVIKKKIAKKRPPTKRRIKKKLGKTKKPSRLDIEGKTQSLAAKKSAVKAKVRKSSPEFYVGEITHYFQKISVVVVKVVEHPILVGDFIHIKGSSTNFTQKVDSLQVESKDVRFARKGELVGLQVVEIAKPGDKLYKIKK